MLGGAWELLPSAVSTSWDAPEGGASAGNSLELLAGGTGGGAMAPRPRCSQGHAMELLLQPQPRAAACHAAGHGEGSSGRAAAGSPGSEKGLCSLSVGHVAMWEHWIYSPPGLSAHTRLDNSWELCGLTKNSPGELAAMSQSCLDRLLSRRLPPSLREMAREVQSLAVSFVCH